MNFITTLQPDEIFVFGSNLAGIHGAGAARQALECFGAKWGVGRGMTGRSYAFPTKDEQLCTRMLHELEEEVIMLYAVARNYPDFTFLVTPVGCGLAGYHPSQVAPLFLNQLVPDNVRLPSEFTGVPEVEESEAAT